MKYSFRNDYSELCHPAILTSLQEASNQQFAGYGVDFYSLEAAKRIKEKLQCNHCDIHFVAGGTQANLTVISHLLRPFEAVLSATSGHINVHETGAIEGTGHKVFTVSSKDGKLRPADIEEAITLHSNEHMVKIGMVYISQSTEFGTVYNKEELSSLYQCCKENDLFLYIDGARLSSGLAASDVQFEELKELCDVMYIGGTKIGMLLGEAIVIFHDQLKPYFRYHMKNRGALLAKGSVIGIQFLRAFQDDLYFELGRQENEIARFLSNEIKQLGVPLLVESKTNQIFPILTKEQVKLLSELYDFEIWDSVGEQICIRLVTSWFTTKEVCKELIEDLKKILDPSIL